MLILQNMPMPITLREYRRWIMITRYLTTIIALNSTHRSFDCPRYSFYNDSMTKPTLLRYSPILVRANTPDAVFNPIQHFLHLFSSKSNISINDFVILNK